MYTDCPGCQRQFHIYATQISAAGGLVKCGFCGLQFNALERLRDKPLSRPKPVAPTAPSRQTLPEPEFVIPEAGLEQVGENQPAPSARAVTATASEVTTAPLKAGDYANQSEAVTHAGPAEDGIDETAPPKMTGKEAVVTGLPQPVSFEFNETLSEQPIPRSGRFSRLLWAVGVLVLTLFAATQVIWFNRDAIMIRYPQTVSWYNRLCATVDCTSIRHRDLAAIKLLNRDVREHPRYENALLVNATMSNQSQSLQPYPIVQLNLYDTSGNLLAYRQFQPQDYLGDTINIAEGMEPDVPVHFVLEILDAAAGAVSFEFEFH